MKRISLLLVALNALLTSAVFAVNDVGSFYVVLKQQRYNQTSTSTPTLSSGQPYRFSSIVSRASGGTLTSGTLTPPNTGSVNTAQPYAPNTDGTGSLQYEQRFSTLSALNAAFGSGLYLLHIIGGNGTYDSQLTLSGGIYPGEIPQVANTNFSNGALVIDRTQPFTVTWNSFADHGANDVVVFSLSDSNGQNLMQQILAPTATSQLIPANTFQTAQQYSINLIFIKVSDVNTVSIPGSSGSAGYGLSTKINISIASSLALDPSFQAPSFRTPDGSKLLLLPDGKFVLYSLIQTLADQPAGPVTRYLTDGTLDSAFLFSSDYYFVLSATVTPAGRLIAAADQTIYGVFDADFDGFHILALNSDGSIDSSFDSTARATGGEVRAMTVQPDGKILVAGRFTKYGGVTRNGIVRLLANGAVDPGFAPVTLTAANSSVQPPALWVEPAVQSDGKILIAGDFDTVNGVACPGVARLNSDGTRDSSFNATDFSLSLAGNGTTRPIRGLVIQADGKIVLGGRFTVSADFAANHTGQIFTRLPLIRLNSDGSADQNYGYFGNLNRATGFSLIRHMNMQPDGKIVAVGNSVFRFNDTDGSLDSSFQQIDLTTHGDPGGGTQIYRIQIQPDARILIGGTFTEITGAAGERFGVARLNSDGSVDSLTTSEQPAQKTAPSSFARQPDGSVLIAFSLRQSGTGDLAVPHSYGRLLSDGSFDGSFDPLASIPNPISALGFSTLPSGNIFVFGTDFSSGIFSYTVITPSGANIGLPNADPNVSFANAYPQPDGKVIVASPDAQSVVNHTQLQRLNADGSVDGSFNLSAQIDQVLRDGSTNITTVASGDAVLSILSSTKILFAYLATDGTHRLVRLNNDGSLDSTFPTASFAASTTSLSPTFVFDPQHPGPPLARVTTLSANFPPFGDAQELTSGKVIVVGDFTSYLGNPVHGIVRLMSDGTFDSTFQPAGGAQWTQTAETTTVHPDIDNIELGDNGKLLITGTFEAFNGTVMPGIALLNADGSLDTSFAAPITRQKLDPYPTYLARQPDGSFLLSGAYSSAGQRESPSFFRILSPLQLTTAVSRKTHGGAGTFDINLLNANFGPECRSSGGNHTLVFTFTNNLTSGSASVTGGTGSVSGSPTFSGGTMTVSLTGVTDVQKITVTLSGVTDSFSQVLPDTAVSVNMLVGDTNGNKAVSASDVAQTKAQSGAAVTGTNFRTDVNAGGTITASDVAQVKANAGHTLP